MKYQPPLKMTEEQQKRWIKDMADSMRKQDELEHGLLCEMARVGYFGDKYEVYINTNDPGNEPHFHVRDIKTQGEDFHTCVKIKKMAGPVPQCASNKRRSLSPRVLVVHELTRILTNTNKTRAI